MADAGCNMFSPVGNLCVCWGWGVPKQVLSQVPPGSLQIYHMEVGCARVVCVSLNSLQGSWHNWVWTGGAQRYLAALEVYLVGKILAITPRPWKR